MSCEKRAPPEDNRMACNRQIWSKREERSAASLRPLQTQTPRRGDRSGKFRRRKFWLSKFARPALRTWRALKALGARRGLDLWLWFALGVSFVFCMQQRKGFKTCDENRRASLEDLRSFQSCREGFRGWIAFRDHKGTAVGSAGLSMLERRPFESNIKRRQV